MSLMGDVYFGGSRSSAGGFRATSGLIYGSRTSLAGMSAMAPASGLLNVDRRLFGASPAPSATRTDRSTRPAAPCPTSASATAAWRPQRLELQRRPRPGLARPEQRGALGRVFGGSQNLDDVVRDMRLTPVVQLGASYSF
jgi:hypothetical protein